MLQQDSIINDDIFHSCALSAYVDIVRETGVYPPDSKLVRRRAYRYYEEEKRKMIKKPKYGNKKCAFNGKKFDSLSEMHRYVFLLEQEKRGVISDLKTQDSIEIVINDHKICKYLADFTYQYKGKYIIEDVKGWAITPVFRIKAKLVKAVHNLDIYIVKKEHLTMLPL